MADAACLDSSLLLKLLAPEPGSGSAATLVSPGTRIFAPAFAWAEVGGALIRRLQSGRMTAAETEAAWEAFLRLRVSFFQNDTLIRRAWDMAREMELPTLYDAACLAVAELAPGGPHLFWTADEALLRSAGGDHPLVRRVSAT